LQDQYQHTCSSSKIYMALIHVVMYWLCASDWRSAMDYESSGNELTYICTQVHIEVCFVNNEFV
jgi:hypothetical protein